MNRTPECQNFELHLIDLAYGELPEAVTEELRGHAAQCPECRNALENIMLTRRLASQLPLLDPSPEIDAAVLEAARVSAPSPSTREVTKNEERLPLGIIISQQKQHLIERLRAFFLTPALATTALASLILVLSFFLFKQLSNDTGKQDTELALVGEPPVAQDETFGRPAEPRVTPSETETAHRAFAEPPPSESTTKKRGSAPKRKRRSSEQFHESEHRGRIIEDLDHEMPSLRPAISRPGPRGAESHRSAKKTARSSKSKRKSAGGGLVAREPRNLPNRRFEAPSSSAAEESVKQYHAPAAPSATGDVQGFEKDRASLDDSMASKAAGASKPAAESPFRKGMDAYSRGNCPGAIEHLKRVVNGPKPGSRIMAQSLLHIARCERRRGRCGAAAPWYDQFLSRFPNHKERASALWEAAACHRRLGNLTRTQRLLGELQRYPKWEQRSKKELERLNSQ